MELNPAIYSNQDKHGYHYTMDVVVSFDKIYMLYGCDIFGFCDNHYTEKIH